MSRIRLDALAAQGRIGADTPVRLADSPIWNVLGETFGGEREPIAPSLPALVHCSRCGGIFRCEAVMRYRELNLCATCKQDYFQHLAQGTTADRALSQYAFAKRAMAKAMDMSLTFMVFIMAMATLISVNENEEAVWPATTALAAALIFHITYTTLATARYGGTLGKRLFHLRVADLEGYDAGYLRALARAVAEIASMACAGLGYLVSSGGERRTLHDRMAFTRVVPEQGPSPWR